MKIVFLCLSLFLTACATQKFTINKGLSSVASVDEMQAFFVSGIGQTQHIDAAKVCGGANNIARVEVQQTLLDGVLGFFTWGIYTPRNARVFCVN